MIMVNVQGAIPYSAEFFLVIFLRSFPSLILIPLQGRDYFQPPFTDKEIEAQRGGSDLPKVTQVVSGRAGI